MMLDLTGDEIAFRAEVRAFLANALSPDTVREQELTVAALPEPALERKWHEAVYRKGWAAPLWPTEYGGPGWTPLQRYIFEHECAAAGAPLVHQMGVRLVGPIIMRFGSDAQKARFLPAILSGEDYWCQGYSEPGAGSDLASLSTAAVRHGDCYVVNGSKIWTTHAHYANWVFALVRTSREPRRQDGISFLLIPMDSPGITVRPIRSIAGDHEFNQVFFDDVRVPAENLVGEEGKGWSYSKALLEFERGGVLASARLRREMVRALRVVEAAKGAAPMLADSKLQADISLIEGDLDALDMMELRAMVKAGSGRAPSGAMPSILKLRASELKQLIARFGYEHIGDRALRWEPHRPYYEAALPDDGDDSIVMAAAYLHSRAASIYGGSSEVQRNIIAGSILHG